MTVGDLLERDRELDMIARALECAGDGDGAIVLVEAPAGTGKTSVLAVGAERATAQGLRCLRGRGSPLEGRFAYGLVRQLLEPAVAVDPGVLDAGAAALARPLFAPDAAETGDEFALLHGLYWLVNALAARHPLALVVDDLHWSDAASLRFLAYLAPRVDGLAVAVLAATRPREGDAVLLAQLAAMPEVELVRPAALSHAATAVLCERSLGTPVAPEVVAACLAVTGGNPFFLRELLREVGEQGEPDAQTIRGIAPASIAQAVLLRLADAPDAAMAVVRALAVLGDGATVDEVAAVAGLDRGDVLGAVDGLADLGLLRRAVALEFSHPIVSRAVYADLGPGERDATHARAADVLLAAGAPPARVAAQLEHAAPAGDPGRVAVLRRAAGEAAARSAPDVAANWLTRALAEPPPPEQRGDVLLELGEACLRLGVPDAVEHLTAAAELLDEPPVRARALRGLAGAQTVAGRSDRALDALAQAIELLEAVDREGALQLEAERAAHAQWAPLAQRGPAAERLRRYAGLSGATAGERVVLATIAAQRGRACESADEAAAIYADALAGGRLIAEQRLDGPGPVYHLIIGLVECDALDVLDAALDQMLDVARARGAVPTVVYATAWRAIVALRRGNVAAATEDARMARELLTAHDIEMGRDNARALLVNALLDCGDVDAAERAFGDLDAPIAPDVTRNFLLRVRSLLHVARGRPQQAIDDLRAFVAHEETHGDVNPLSFRWRSEVALALGDLGQVDDARALAAEDLVIARRWGTASGIGTATRAVALLADGEERIRGLAEAATILAPAPTRLEYAQALVDHGAALRRANRRAEARRPLEAGLEIAQRVGADGLAAHARTELRAAGARPRDPDRDALTISERRVAELAAAGRSNPEIAQALFITRKTVETHLGRAYRKLDIGGRRELAPALRDP